MQQLHGMKGSEFTTGGLADMKNKVRNMSNNNRQKSAEVIVIDGNEPRKKTNKLGGLTNQ
jgi:hypothetical protein